ncbi:MAG: hypothetical protein K2X87_10750 [Gemmataceae bacterium]|nr:hypothetical protein [Gemmataceae bacterium]
MPRRFPILPALVAAAVGLFALTPVLPAQPPAAAPDALKRTEEQNLELYKRFANELLKLAQRWEKSDSPDEKARAKTLRAALEIGQKHGVENLFRGLVGGLGGPRAGGELSDLIAKDRVLVKALEEILETLDTEDEAEQLKRQRIELEELVKLVTQLKREEETLRARTGVPKSDLEKIARDQAALAKRTQDLADRMSKADPKSPKAGPPNPKDGNPQDKDETAEPKPEGKPGEDGAEPKPDTKESKAAEKDGAGREAKPSPKDGPAPNGGRPKPSPKDGAADPTPGKGTGGPKPPAGDPKGGDPKPMPAGDGKPPGDGKGEAKPSKGQGGEAKPTPGGEPKDSPPSGSKGGSKSGGKPGGGKPGAQRPPNPNNPNDDAQRHVEEAVPPQEDAEQDLKKSDREQAGKNEDKAIDALTKALKELEKRLKQLREKEMLKKLEDLERRVAKMLRMQVEVYEATKQIDGIVKKNKGEMTSPERQKSQVQGDNEGLIVEEAAKALRLLEGEGTAVVFAGVLLEARKDMEAVQKQLTLANVGPDTQLVEEQIIEQLKRMLEALKKAKQDLENPPPPPPPGQPPPNDGKKNLIQLVEQLKLLKDLQLQVNQRTTAFGTRSPGEQATDPFIREQLRQLGDRQKVLQDMLHKIASQMTQQ